MENAPEYRDALELADGQALDSGLGMLRSGFSMTEFLKSYEPRDDLDEVLQPVFEVLARDFPEHRLVITGSKATLERFTEVSSYMNIAAAREVFAALGDDIFGCFMEKIADAASQFAENASNTL